MWEAGGVLAPVEVAAVDNDAADGGAVAADPLGGAMDDDIGAVGDGAAEETSGAECVVDLYQTSEMTPLARIMGEFV